MTHLLSVVAGAIQTGEGFPWLLVLFMMLLFGSIACIVLLFFSRKK